MMSRALSVMLAIGLLCGVACADPPFSHVIRPRRVDADVKGCLISEPGEYRASVGDLIEVEYSFPVAPQTVPKKVDQETDKGAIYTSKLGIRNLIVPKIIGTGTYLFYFDAKHEGKGTAFVVIDGVKYAFGFEVAERLKRTNK